MDTTTAAAALAAVSGLAAYINGKYHVVQDLKALKFKYQAAKYYAGVGTYSVLNPCYNSNISC